MSKSITTAIQALFQKTFGTAATEILPLKRTASGRQYFRVTGNNSSCIATHGLDAKENEAFISFSKHFKNKGLSVPEIFAEDLEQDIYIQEDLGNQTLYELLPKNGEDIDESLKVLYRKTLGQLAQLQIEGGKGLDYTKCTPHSDFDQQSMQWDLNYFKYFFLKLTGFTFDEAALEKDFQNLIQYLLKADCQHFMFRDFQSRNIMVQENEPWFIDYQGGRRGAMQYDVASLLYQPAANLSEATIADLLAHYLTEVEKWKTIDRSTFLDLFYGYVLIRRIQTLGTYGLRGIHERYTHFLKSIPIALNQITTLFEIGKIKIALPELERVLTVVNNSGRFSGIEKAENKLTVTVSSFSYKRAIPKDPSGNGGGFVFDCRFLNNPGRYQPYKKQTGRDQPVIEFLQAHSNIEDFLSNAYFMVDEAIENYIERGFDHLMVSFGCTGGQHRSVYSADNMAKHLEEKYGVKVVLQHVEQELKGWIN
ncbi:MAG: aminoglycoside/choline kinase family phosphotransferase [Polaribacter sp.]|jgi:aminoglycoside/choline kinase family phosphotransferase